MRMPSSEMLNAAAVSFTRLRSPSRIGAPNDNE